MKTRLCLLTLLLLAAVPAPAQGRTDRELVQQALEQQPAQKDTSKHKFYHLIRHQMRGRCYYEPECVDFFPQAVKDLGPVRGTLSTLDRLTRCTYLGTAAFPLKGVDGKVHEGTQAYRRRRESK